MADTARSAIETDVPWVEILVKVFTFTSLEEDEKWAVWKFSVVMARQRLAACP
jgi:hypothetical protein